jgi:hypothetical protein
MYKLYYTLRMAEAQYSANKLLRGAHGTQPTCWRIKLSRLIDATKAQ